jgi:hypothetical protein
MRKCCPSVAPPKEILSPEVEVGWFGVRQTARRITLRTWASLASRRMAKRPGCSPERALCALGGCKLALPVNAMIHPGRTSLAERRGTIRKSTAGGRARRRAPSPPMVFATMADPDPNFRIAASALTAPTAALESDGRHRHRAARLPTCSATWTIVVEY